MTGAAPISAHDLSAIAANLVTIILAGAAFWRFGRHAFRRAVREEVVPIIKAEVAPTLLALQKHADVTAASQKKLKKSQAKLATALVEHTASDQDQFKEVLAELKTLNVQGTEAAAKIVTVATQAAKEVAAVAATTAIQTDRVAIAAAEAAKLVAADTATQRAAEAEAQAERVADIAAAKAIALNEAARTKSQ